MIGKSTLPVRSSKAPVLFSLQRCIGTEGRLLPCGRFFPVDGNGSIQRRLALTLALVRGWNG